MVRIHEVASTEWPREKSLNLKPQGEGFADNGRNDGLKHVKLHRFRYIMTFFIECEVMDNMDGGGSVWPLG